MWQLIQMKDLNNCLHKAFFLRKNYATCESYFCNLFYVTKIAYTSGDWLDIVKNEIKRD